MAYAVSIYVSKKVGRYPIMAKGGKRVLTYTKKSSANAVVKSLKERGLGSSKPMVITEKSKDFMKPAKLYANYRKRKK